MALIITTAFLPGSQASAAEGGGSDYLQGTYNDFAMGMVRPPGAEGPTETEASMPDEEIPQMDGKD